MDHADIFSRYQSAVQLIEDGKQLDEATTECVWLWQHMLEHAPAMRGVRLSFFLVALSHLIQAHPAAKDTFSAIRDALEDRVRRADLRRDDLSDWLSLNKVLQKEDRTLRWFDEVFPQADWLAIVQSQEIILFPLLLSRGRWREAGLLLVNPVKELRRRMDALLAPSLAGGDSEVEDAQRGILRKMAAEMCGALAAASRIDEAMAVQREAESRDRSDDMKQAIADTRKAAEEHRPVKQLF